MTQESKFKKEYSKLLSRRDELVKQELTLKREYTTLLRKISSIVEVLSNLGNKNGMEETKFPSGDLIGRMPDLEKLDDDLRLLDSKPTDSISIPAELEDSYLLFKNTCLLYKDLADEP